MDIHEYICHIQICDIIWLSFNYFPCHYCTQCVSMLIINFVLFMQFAGINGVLYYTPQILEQAGVGVLLSNIGLSSSSASILISALTTLLMLPSIGIAMRLMDMSGRRLDFVFDMLLWIMYE